MNSLIQQDVCLLLWNLNGLNNLTFFPFAFIFALSFFSNTSPFTSIFPIHQMEVYSNRFSLSLSLSLSLSHPFFCWNFETHFPVSGEIYANAKEEYTLSLSGLFHCNFVLLKSILNRRVFPPFSQVIIAFKIFKW